MRRFATKMIRSTEPRLSLNLHANTADKAATSTNGSRVSPVGMDIRQARTVAFTGSVLLVGNLSLLLASLLS